MTAETNRTRFSIIDDSRMRLADDLDIAPDGKVYFSEATIRYGFRGMGGRRAGRARQRPDHPLRSRRGRHADNRAQSAVRQRHVRGP
jgi:hypothetical protein